MPSARYIPPEAELVDDTDTLKLCLADLYATPAPAAIAIDLEGIDLCRHGKISIIQLYAHKSKTVWIIDVTTLKDDAFDEKDDRGYSLRGLLEDKDIKKVRLFCSCSFSRVDSIRLQVFFDVRNDSDALYKHYNVNLKGTYDLQVLELVLRRANGGGTAFLHGLAKTMSAFGVGSLEWDRVKQAGLKLFAPERGGSYQVFEERPLREEIIAYCAQDATSLLELEKAMIMSLSTYGSVHRNCVLVESAARVTESQSSWYNPYGRGKARANVNWIKYSL